MHEVRNYVGVHYLSHRRTVKENSTVNIRAVFTASSHLLCFPSLDDCLSTGPNLIRMIPSILHRFLMNYVSVTPDNEKAFFQIAKRERDRDFLRFLCFGKENRGQMEMHWHQR